MQANAVHESPFFSLEGPLDVMPSDRQVRMANLSGFASYVRARGAEPRAILEDCGVEPARFRDPDQYIDCQSLVDVLEHCSRHFDDSLFGLRLAELQEPDVYGCVTALCRSAAVFRQAVQSFIEYLPVIHSPASVLDLVESRETAELRWSVRTDLGANGQAFYQAMMLNLKLLRALGGPGFRPSYIDLAVDVRKKDVPEIERRIGCRLHGRAAVNAMGFPAAVLDQPVGTCNPLLFRLLGGYLERVKAASRTTVVERVEDYIRGALPLGNCSIDRCADKLGTSIRSLQARLAESGVRFSAVLERERGALACGYLETGRLTLDEVAARLGYSEQSSFGRAFKRWTGSTPRRFRAARGRRST